MVWSWASCFMHISANWPPEQYIHIIADMYTSYHLTMERMWAQNYDKQHLQMFWKKSSPPAKWNYFLLQTQLLCSLNNVMSNQRQQIMLLTNQHVTNFVRGSTMAAVKKKKNFLYEAKSSLFSILVVLLSVSTHAHCK